MATDYSTDYEMKQTPPGSDQAIETSPPYAPMGYQSNYGYHDQQNPAVYSPKGNIMGGEVADNDSDSKDDDKKGPIDEDKNPVIPEKYLDVSDYFVLAITINHKIVQS